MPSRKLYAGVKLRELRTRMSLTQKAFAAKLGISLPYLNQMENNNRPVSTSVVLAMAQEFGFDVTELSIGDAERMVTDMREALSDPIFSEIAPPVADLRLAASNAPNLSRAFLELHRAYRQTHERLASLDEVLGQGTASLQSSPWEEVRDFFHYCDNYIDAVDRAAERFAVRVGPDPLRARDLSFTVQYADNPSLRHFDSDTNTLTLSASASPASQRFQLLHQVALLEQNELLEATLDLARFQTDAARQIAKSGLANYFAGAAQMPYDAFLNAAHDTRHDLERLADRFVRVDQAGTITKRHSATRLQFARYGGPCPLWNVHRAFETPGRFLRQLAETPDGVRYISIARDVSKPGGSFAAPTRRYAIALGCEMTHASALVYADDLLPAKPQAFEPIGISCRICPRRDCHQRSVPPLESQLSVDHDRRGTLPYSVD